jgi:hypothetical protein
MNDRMINNHKTPTPKDPAAARAAVAEEVRAAGETYKNFGGVALARSVIAQGGNLREFQSRLKSSGALNNDKKE